MKKYKLLKCKFCNNKKEILLKIIKEGKLKDGDILCDICWEDRDKRWSSMNSVRKKWGDFKFTKCSVCGEPSQYTLGKIGGKEKEYCGKCYDKEF